MPDPHLRRLAAELAAERDGVVGRGLLIERGWSASMIRAEVSASRWQAIHPGVYAVRTGALSARARVWAALVYCGEDAVVAGSAAAWLWGLVDEQPVVVEVAIPATRRVRSVPGVIVRRDRGLATRRHPAVTPPRLRVEEVALDLADASRDTDELVSWLTRACQRRLTTPARLVDALSRRPRMRRRGLLGQVLAACAEGAASPLELRWRRDVERPHGLPPGRRNVAERGASGTVYRDIRYGRYRVLVELDGRLVHPFEQRGRDAMRDRLATIAGDVTVRYGWGDVADRACASAMEMGALLTSRGWRGRLRPCSPRCPVARAPLAA